MKLFMLLDGPARTVIDFTKLLNQEVLKGLRVKMLADVFESIVGAIFVDTDGDLGEVSRVIHRLLDGRIRKLFLFLYNGIVIGSYLEVTPNNPLRLMHLIHSDLKYTELSSTDSEDSEGKYKLTATVGGRQIFVYGSTRNEARLALARQLGVSTH
ncbi:hypothetical protein FBUS_08367 [Fasciolopsis buskii]|uniref:RNase III domain-containing protein n=1 Tax=Fasciolopsis buskii TaxID=27845 RepID=A0A8E0VM41_9TREM|nr:hypothetical protein FBUS_08367 [Fasciolopsis buski]